MVKLFSTQKILDKLSFYLRERWLFTGLLALIFFSRVFFWQGWYIVAYAYGIYLINLLILFLSPKIDPEIDPENPDLVMDDEEDLGPTLFGLGALSTKENRGPALPSQDDEFKPFVRVLPEFKFWVQVTQGLLISTFLSFFRVFDIPCYWPILLGYFIFLFVLMMQKRIQHMWKHKYLPFSWGKKHYGKNVPTSSTSGSDMVMTSGFSTFRKLPPGFIDESSASSLSPTPFSYEDGMSTSGLGMSSSMSSAFNDMGVTSTLNENTFGRITTNVVKSSSIALEPIQIPSTMKKVK